MDNHFKIVTDARARSVDSPARGYFGYATILDRPAFDDWRAQHGYVDFVLPAGQVAEALDVDLVFDFPSRFWAGRVAGLADRPGASVFGLLFEIPGKDWPIIEHKEGAVTGMCVPRELRVRVGGEVRTATAFTTHPARASEVGPVSQPFVAALVRGAESVGLPSEYVARLRARAGQAV
jgi:cation transport regulator ChaC